MGRLRADRVRRRGAGPAGDRAVAASGCSSHGFAGCNPACRDCVPPRSDARPGALAERPGARRDPGPSHAAGADAQRGFRRQRLDG
jgi:hypothetical protein